MNSKQEEKLKEIDGELAKDIKTGEDLSSLSAKLVKLTVEAALGAEMENHLGYPPHALVGHFSGNSRNVTTPKILKGDHGEVRIETPWDRNGTFEPDREFCSKDWLEYLIANRIRVSIADQGELQNGECAGCIGQCRKIMSDNEDR